MGTKTTKLTTANYKGTRDFYPEDMRLRTYMFSTMRQVVESYGYLQYDAPMLESIELYKAKSGEEIVERQLYDFVDKGERHVAIRPEMTPTLARMIAAKLREIPRPIRWYSIPNLWRYEAPGKGRLREHWQLNVDIFGVNSYKAEAEIIRLASDILFAFGASSDQFIVKISHRDLLNQFLGNSLKLEDSKIQAVAKILDKKNKISKDEFEASINQLISDNGQSLSLIYQYLDSTLDNIHDIVGISSDVIGKIKSLFADLKKVEPIPQLEFDPSIIRGFDYYTGFIFEIFDTNPENRRSLYGGGRYDNLIGLFSNEELSGIGFGLGDVTLQNFLESHKLLPSFKNVNGFFIPNMGDSLFDKILEISHSMRKIKIPTEIMLESGKFGKQIALAEKKGYKYILIIGEDEIKNNQFVVKDLETGVQTTYTQIEDLLKLIKN